VHEARIDEEVVQFYPENVERGSLEGRRCGCQDNNKMDKNLQDVGVCGLG
jgi:hypothetical protein